MKLIGGITCQRFLEPLHCCGELRRRGAAKGVRGGQKRKERGKEERERESTVLSGSES
jgi:hypothetical protein